MTILSCPKCNSKQPNEICLLSCPAKYEYICYCGFELRYSKRKDSRQHISQEELNAHYEEKQK